MGLVSRILNSSYSLADFDRDIERAIRGESVKSGVHVNEDTALRFSAVFACVRVLSETLASLPLIVYRRRQNGNGKDRAYDHPLYSLLHDSPNEDMTAMTMKETIMGHLVTSGNGYAYKTITRGGRVLSLYPLNWTRIEPARNKDTRAIEYKFRENDGTTRILSQEEVFHIPGLGFDGIRGYSPTRMAMEAVGLGLAAEEFGARFFGQGANASGTLETDQQMSEPAVERLRTQFAEKHARLSQSHKPILLEQGLKFNKITIPPEEAQFLETRRFQVEEIARINRVPLHLLQDLTRSTNNNIEHQSLEFVMYTMMPWFVRWEQAVNMQLLTPQEREQGYFAEFLVLGLLRGDNKSRADALHIMRQDGIINADEWRDLENMNPQEGDQGKKYLVNGNMIPVELAGKVKATEPPRGGE